MKKLIALLMALTMVAMMAACSTGTNNETPATDATETTEAVNVPTVGSALEVLETIWNAYGDDEKFAVIGGNIENAVDGAPGNYDLAYAENLTYNLLVPAELIANIDDAASMIHMMNANNFTSGVVHLTEGTDVAAFTEAMHTAISTNPWICGFPEKMIVAVIDGSYVLISFGVNDAMNPFEAHLTEVYANAEIIYNEALAG
ncbi:MAG: hypothetical protein UHS47_03395 [Oscillospiraceae bacterium]|nr:hypothetical protein [Oscillospiraceae bacterium]